MNIKDAKEVLRICHKSNTPVLMLSSPGLGKSSIFQQFRTELKEQYQKPVGFIELRSSTLDPLSSSDIKYVDDGSVKEAPQSWVPTQQDIDEGLFPEHGIILCDELLDGPLVAQSALQRLVLDRMVGSRKVADGWYIGAASNSQKHRAAAGRLSSALANRFLILEIEPDPDVSYEYFMSDECPDYGIPVPAYLRFRPDCIQPPDFSAQNESPQFCSPRSLEKLANLVMDLPDSTPDSLKLEMFSGLVGPGRGSEFLGFLTVYEQLPDLNKLMAEPATYPVPKAPDVLIATIYALIARLTNETAKSLIKFFVRIPSPDIATVALKDSLAQCPEIARTDEWKEWASQNVELLR